jgi:hypothetical protein
MLKLDLLLIRGCLQLEEDIFELEDGAARSWLAVPDFRSEEFLL